MKKKSNRLVHPILNVIVILFLTASHQAVAQVESVQDDTQIVEKTDNIVSKMCLRDSIVSYAMTFLNKPYCYSGRGGKCFDCSGLAIVVFNNFNIELPPSSSTQAVCGSFINPINALPGDLIFFSGRKQDSEDVGHVGIITEVSDEVYFIHASVKSGVIISSLNENYYNTRFLCVKRILENEEIAEVEDIKTEISAN